MTVYVIRRKGSSDFLVKIGFSENLEKRLLGLMTAAPEGHEVIYALDGDRRLEKAIHAHFASKRVRREWFMLSKEEVEEIPSLEFILSEEVTEKHLPSSADECSENIVHETRFYLNELVKREWRGVADTVLDAVGRVMDSCGLPRSYGSRLWHKYQTMKGVSGDAYRCLRLSYALKLKDEDKLNDNQRSFLRTMARTYKNMPHLQQSGGFGCQEIVALIPEFFPEKPVAAGLGMDAANSEKGDG